MNQATARRKAGSSDALLLALAALGEAAVFYGRYFSWYGWGELALPALVTLFPALV